MSDPTLSDIDFKNKMAWLWISESQIPLLAWEFVKKNSILESWKYYTIVLVMIRPILISIALCSTI